MALPHGLAARLAARRQEVDDAEGMQTASYGGTRSFGAPRGTIVKNGVDKAMSKLFPKYNFTAKPSTGHVGLVNQGTGATAHTHTLLREWHSRTTTTNTPNHPHPNKHAHRRHLLPEQFAANHVHDA